MLLTIGEVSKKLGVCITTIRRWEKLNKINKNFWQS
jgi:DNA-binding transcriptional MerR regulator